MTRRPKQIVIDKDVFVALSGKRFKALCDFCNQRHVLISDTLLYECATATKQNAGALLQKLEDLVRLGAQCCSMSKRFIQWEAWYCRPYPRTLADKETTDQIRSGIASPSALQAPVLPKYLRDSRTQVANSMFAQPSTNLKLELDWRVEDLCEKVKRIPSSPAERMRCWLDGIDRMEIHAMALSQFPAGWIRVKGEFCLSPAWITWQCLRLVMVNIYEYWYCRQTGGPRDKQAEHDLADMECVLLLSRADGIITKDKRLARMARVVFPGKDVFSSLEAVPESYRCDWAGL